MAKCTSSSTRKLLQKKANDIYMVVLTFPPWCFLQGEAGLLGARMGHSALASEHYGIIHSGRPATMLWRQARKNRINTDSVNSIQQDKLAEGWKEAKCISPVRTATREQAWSATQRILFFVWNIQALASAIRAQERARGVGCWNVFSLALEITEFLTHLGESIWVSSNISKSYDSHYQKGKSCSILKMSYSRSYDKSIFSSISRKHVLKGKVHSHLLVQ